MYRYLSPVAVLVAAALLGLAWAGTGSAATKAESPPRFPFCSWWFETTPQTVNVALPDTSAAYWTTPFFADPGLKITVKGQFPDARFMSVTVYDNSAGTFVRNGVSSALSDYLIEPDPGTRNPFQESTRGHGRFSLTIQRDVSPLRTNVLPLVPAQPASGLFPPGNGFIIFQVYLPHSGSFDSVRLPELVFSRDGRTQTLPKCSGNNPKVQPLARELLSQIQRFASDTPKFPPPYDPLAFSRPLAATTNSLFPNNDSRLQRSPMAGPGVRSALLVALQQRERQPVSRCRFDRSADWQPDLRMLRGP
jgi:hypothetical protein